ncbi:MAG: molybdopterin adenylyltransferase [Planctomycetota bacterium]
MSDENNDTSNPSAIIGVVTISDRASSGEYEDRSGPAIRHYLEDVLLSQFEIEYRVIPDEQPLIESTLIELADEQNCCLIVTTGGTGPASRDVTPEATENVCDKMMPGFGETMRAVSLTKVPTAILSRQTAGIRSSSENQEQNLTNRKGQSGSLIVNLPGSPKAIAECLDAIFAAIPYCIDLIEGPFLDTNPQRIVAFRPKK